MTLKASQRSSTHRTLTSENITADIAAFCKQGGRIEVLGNTPLRRTAPSPFHSSAEQRKLPTPLPKKTASS